jgi:hypothetical protein
VKLEICPETWNQPRPDQGAMRRLVGGRGNPLCASEHLAGVEVAHVPCFTTVMFLLIPIDATHGKS